jgi:predicted acetyltransferase
MPTIEIKRADLAPLLPGGTKQDPDWSRRLAKVATKPSLAYLLSMPLILITPTKGYLPEYVDALLRGWSADNIRGSRAAADELERIAQDPDGYLASLDDREARGAPIPMPDGTFARRLPSVRRWLWDEGFCGTIALRWLKKGSAELPPHVLGHIGYAVVPWRRGRGYAAQGLRLLLPEARLLGLPWVEVTTDPDNIASQRAILAVGGRFIETFQKPDVYGHGETQRWRIDL